MASYKKSIIDPDNQDQLLISCWNLGHSKFTIQPGDRIAQLVFVPVVRTQFELIPEFAATARGAGGFGHSDVE